MLYRYEIQSENNSVGILTGLDEYFTVDEIWSLGWFFEVKLNAPDIDMCNTKSYFTEKGNRKFRKAIRNISKLSESKGLKVVCITVNREDLDNIVYEDVNQVIIKYVSVA